MEVVVAVFLTGVAVSLILALSEPPRTGATQDSVTRMRRIGSEARREINRICDDELRKQIDYLMSIPPGSDGDEAAEVRDG